MSSAWYYFDTGFLSIWSSPFEVPKSSFSSGGEGHKGQREENCYLHGAGMSREWLVPRKRVQFIKELFMNVCIMWAVWNLREIRLLYCAT